MKKLGVKLKNKNIMIDLFFGKTSPSLINVWSIAHLLNGIIIGYLVMNLNLKILKKNFGTEIKNINTKYFDLILILFIAFLWETIEHYLEEGILGGNTKYWFQGIEHWANRIIFDPLMFVVGYFLVRKFKKLVLPATLISLTWVGVNIFIFPHIMYIYEIF